jgi:ABC-type nitrate/sulfonate/bicarbonate transport system substrate-binding protein
MTNARLPFLLNWYANPYHAPIFVAKELGYFEQEDINLAVLEPTDPSDVTELVGTGRADMGLKAMIHTIAGRVRGFPLKAIGMLLDEPPTGLLYYSNKAGAGSINGIQDLKGKRIGYIGEFGKYILDDLLRKNDVNPMDVHTVRVGMKVPDALAAGVIDAGIGLGNFQLIEVENTMLNEGGAAGFLKFDESLGIHCCFCSVLYIANERFLKEKPELARGFMRAIRRATDFTLQKPNQAFEVLSNVLPRLRRDEETNHKIFHASVPYLSKDLYTKEKDWYEVKEYMEGLKLIDANSFDIDQCYTNSLVPKEVTA